MMLSWVSITKFSKFFFLQIFTFSFILTLKTNKLLRIIYALWVVRIQRVLYCQKHSTSMNWLRHKFATSCDCRVSICRFHSYFASRSSHSDLSITFLFFAIIIMCWTSDLRIDEQCRALTIFSYNASEARTLLKKESHLSLNHWQSIVSMMWSSLSNSNIISHQIKLSLCQTLKRDQIFTQDSFNLSQTMTRDSIVSSWWKTSHVHECSSSKVILQSFRDAWSITRLFCWLTSTSVCFCKTWWWFETW